MIDFVGKRYWYFLLSAIIIVPGIISLIVFGLKLGLDFHPGIRMTLQFRPEVTENSLRQSLSTLGFGDAVIQQQLQTKDFDLLLRKITPDEKQQLIDGLAASLSSNVTVQEYGFAAAVVTDQTSKYAITAVLLAAVGILLYISWAFRKMPNPLRWGTCAVIALLHDIFLVLGVFSILGWLAGVQIDSLFITGMLTVAGYSVHDTIVVFDRIRENLTRGVSPNFDEVVNYSILQTLTRSLNTSITVVFVLFALFLLGGATIHYFVLVLLIGVITGTYSSVCNASQLLIVWEKGEWGRFIGRKPAEIIAK